MKQTLFSLILVGLLFLCTTVVADEPEINNVEPSNETIDYETLVNIQANIIDSDGDLREIFIELSNNGNVIDSLSKVLSENKSYYSINHIFEGLSPGVEYQFDILAEDYYGNSTNSSYSFVTCGDIEDDDDEPDKITIIPDKPKAGKNAIFLLDEVEQEIGYVYCEESGNVYLVEVKDGMGFVELDKEFGNATVVFPDYGNKKFEFRNPYEGEIDINIPMVADLQEDIPVTVYVAGEQTAVPLTFISPNNKKIHRMTDADDPIAISFDISGNWTVLAEIYGTTEENNFYINPEPIEINMPQEILAGEETLIGVNTKADVVITKDETTWSYESDDEGKIYFNPPWPGRYKIEVYSQNQEGSDYFMVQSETQITLRNEDGNILTDLSKDDTILIQVTDSQGNIVTSSDVTVIADGNPLKRIELSSGSAIWKVPVDASNYRFTFNTEGETLLSSSLSVQGENKPVQSTVSVNPFAIVFVATLLIIMSLYALHKLEYIDLSFITEYIPQITGNNDLIEEDELF